MSNLYPGDKISPAEAGRRLDQQAQAIARRVRDTGQRCRSCEHTEGECSCVKS